MEITNTPLNFWSQVWQEGTIRFHQKDYNSQMMNFFKDIDLKNKTVFIPLAGKTKDIMYFLERGAHVTAVEFVEQAIVEFFEDNEILYKKTGNLYQCENLNFYAMDLFDFKSENKFDVLYDRASQVVFNSESRPAYYQLLSTVITPQTIVLLGSIDHAGPKEYGPPHKISPEEIKSAYKKMGINLKIFSETTEVTSEKMQNAGISSLVSYFLTNA